MSRYYTQEHEWIEVSDGAATVGITDYAQGQLGDIVFVEVPEAGRELAKGDEAATVESVKAASDVYSPASGSVTAPRNHFSGAGMSMRVTAKAKTKPRKVPAIATAAASQMLFTKASRL